RAGCLAAPRHPLRSGRVSPAGIAPVELHSALSRRVENRSTLAILRASEASVCKPPMKLADALLHSMELQPWLATTRSALESSSQTLFGRHTEIATTRGKPPRLAHTETGTAKARSRIRCEHDDDGSVFRCELGRSSGDGW